LGLPKNLAQNMKIGTILYYATQILIVNVSGMIKILPQHNNVTVLGHIKSSVMWFHLSSCNGGRAVHYNQPYYLASLLRYYVSSSRWAYSHCKCIGHILGSFWKTLGLCHFSNAPLATAKAHRHSCKVLTTTISQRASKVQPITVSVNTTSVPSAHRRLLFVDCHQNKVPKVMLLCFVVKKSFLYKNTTATRHHRQPP